MIKFRPTVCWPRYHGWILEEARLTRVGRDFDRWPRADNSRAENANVCARVYVWERERKRKRDDEDRAQWEAYGLVSRTSLWILQSTQTLRCKLSSFFFVYVRARVSSGTQAQFFEARSGICARIRRPFRYVTLLGMSPLATVTQRYLMKHLFEFLPLLEEITLAVADG